MHYLRYLKNKTISLFKIHFFNYVHKNLFCIKKNLQLIYERDRKMYS